MRARALTRLRPAADTHPRFLQLYRQPWTVILACYIACPLIMIGIGLGLHKENKRRDALPVEEDEDIYIDEVLADGTTVSKKLDLAFADLTDRQNLKFRYCL